MQKTSLNKMDLDVFSKTLSNGLKVYIIPKKEVNNIYVTFTTKYGSNIVEFVPNGEYEQRFQRTGIQGRALHFDPDGYQRGVVRI